MVRLGPITQDDARRAPRRVRHQHLLQRHHLGQHRHHRAPAALLPPRRARRRDHGGNPRAGRPQHVGEAEQRSGGRARQLPQERIPADHRRGALARSPPTTRAASSRSSPRSWRSTSSSACSALDPVQKEILEKIEATLRTEFMSTLAHTKRRDSHEQMAEIFNSFDRQTEARFITTLEEHEPRRRRAHQGADVHLRGPDPARRRRPPDAARRRWTRRSSALALKGANDQVKEVFFANMSARAGKMLKDDMEAMGPVRLKDVDDAQGRMVVDRQGPRGPRRDHHRQGQVRRGDGGLDEHRRSRPLHLRSRPRPPPASAAGRCPTPPSTRCCRMPAPRASPRASPKPSAAPTGRAQPPPPTASPSSAAHDGAQRSTTPRRPPLADAVDLAATIARKLADSLIASQPAAELEALIAECLDLARGRAAPRHPLPPRPRRHRPRHRPRRASTTSGFTGRLVVIGDPDSRARRRPASNGPTAASSATAPRSRPRSTTASQPTSMPAASDAPKETPQ